MRAFAITGTRTGEVVEVDPPDPQPGQVVVAVERAGVCGTDAEFFSGEMSYLHTGQAAYPLRIGHEWCGRVDAVGDGVDPGWLGRLVTGDTMLGCGHCSRCTTGRQHLCADRYEIGVRHGWPGALASRLPVPVTALVPLPDDLDPAVGALVEPGANATRAAGAALAGGFAHGRAGRVLVLGAGTIGLLTALVLRARGAEVALLERRADGRRFAADLGLTAVADAAEVALGPLDAVVDASTASTLPALAVELVEPGGRVVYVGIAGRPSLLDARELALRDITAVGVLSGSGALAEVAALYASGAVDTRPLVAATVGLDGVAAALQTMIDGDRPSGWGAAPKLQVDPRR